MSVQPNTSFPATETGRAWTIVAAVLVMVGINALPNPDAIERGSELIALTHLGKACLAVLAFAAWAIFMSDISYSLATLLGLTTLNNGHLV